MASDPSASKSPQRHIRLTSHPSQQGAPGGALPIKWGAATALERGPVVGSTTNRSQRNVIGTHSGSYGVYRALAVAAGNLVRGHRADLTNTAPTDPIGPYPAVERRVADRVDRSVGRVGRRRVRRLHRAGLRHPSDDRGHEGAHRPARDPACDHVRPARARQPRPARERLGRRHQGRDRTGVVAAGRRGALRRRRGRPAPQPVRGDGRHVPRARHAHRPRGVPAADRRADAVHLRRPARARRSVRHADRARARRVQRLRRVRLRHLHVPPVPHARDRGVHRRRAARRRRADRVLPQGRPRARRGHEVPGLQRAQAPGRRRQRVDRTSCAPSAWPACRTCASRN